MTLRPGSQLLRAGVVLCALLLLAGCDWFAPAATPTPPGPTPLPGTPGPSASPGTPATATAAGGPTLPPGTRVPQGGTLTIRLDKDVTTLNPLLVARGPADVDAAAQTVTGLIFSGLTRIDNHLQPQPDLAESWSVAPDGLSVDFKLRPGVLWSDGQPVTPDDVIWSYQAYLQVPVSSTLQVHLHDAVLAIQPSPVASDTVRFWLKKKYAPLLSDVAAAILPRHLLGAIPPDQMAAAPFSANPVGSGPFMLSDHKAGQRIVLAANPRYYGGRPHLDAVAFLIAPDPAVAEKALSDGSLLAAEVPQDTWRDFAAQAVAQTGFTLGTAPGSAYYFLAFNLRQGHLFADTALRQAVADALDKTRLVRDATDGAGLPIWSDVSPASWAYDTQVSHLDNDPAKAKALLDQAGWAPGAGGIRQKNGQKLASPRWASAPPWPRPTSRRCSRPGSTRGAPPPSTSTRCCSAGPAAAPTRTILPSSTPPRSRRRTTRPASTSPALPPPSSTRSACRPAASTTSPHARRSRGACRRSWPSRCPTSSCGPTSAS